MLRIVLFLVLIALAGAGAAWVADQPGDVVMTWGGYRASPSIPVFVLCLGLFAVAIVLFWSILTTIWRTPGRMRRRRREKRHARGRHAITHGLLAIGHGDTALARRHADAARRHAPDDPLALLLHAQSAQLDGNRDEAQRAFRVMAEREDTRLLGLRGLFIEAQRADDAVGAVMIAEEAIKLSPSSTWASHAVLGFRCARGDWSGALAILDSNLSAGLIDKAAYRRQRGVLLAARALELETMDRDVARESVMEAVKLAPTLVPAAVLAAKFESEAHQVRRAMKLVDAAWLANPHPDLADAYAHVKLGDAARQRLQRVETLAAKISADKPGYVEGQRRSRARRDRCLRVRPCARGAFALRQRSDPARGAVDGRDRAHRAWRRRPCPRLDLARGACPSRSGLDRGRLCQRALASGLPGHRSPRCLPVADAGCEPALGQGHDDRELGLRGSKHAQQPLRRSA